MAVPKKLRFEILKRDHFKCRYCGRTEADGVKLHIDHVIPQALGGRNDEQNLATACADCNLGKSANMLNDPRIIGIDFTEQKKIFDTAHESLARYREYIQAKDEWEFELINELMTPFRRVFMRMPWWDVGADEVFWSYSQIDMVSFDDLPEGLKRDLRPMQVFEAVRNAEAKVRRSVLHFFKNLGPEPVREAAQIAGHKCVVEDDFGPQEAFKYFCGICHNLIAKRGGYADRDR